MNKPTWIWLGVLLLPSISFAQVLSLDGYLAQVKQSNPQMQSTALLEEAANDLQTEGNHVYAPNFFVDYSHVYDKRPTLIPAFQGDKTTQNILNLGIKEQTNFGLQGSVYYAMNSSTIDGVDPLFYPQPHLNVQSMNLELKQSLLQNGFGRSTRAMTESKNSQSLVNLYQQRFQSRIVASEAESHYWQLSIARNLVLIQKNSLDRTQQFHKINSNRARLNLIDKADLVASQAALKQRQLELKNAIDQEKIVARIFNESRGINSDQVSETLDTVTPELKG